jgi:hypothetical protein
MLGHDGFTNILSSLLRCDQSRCYGIQIPSDFKKFEFLKFRNPGRWLHPKPRFGRLTSFYKNNNKKKLFKTIPALFEIPLPLSSSPFHFSQKNINFKTFYFLYHINIFLLLFK